MGEQQGELKGPDLARGIPEGDLADGAMLAGHAHGEAVLLARCGSEVFAVGATCTHYGAPLAEGVLDGEMIRCPWHHACFSARTGERLRSPARCDLPRWNVVRRDGKLTVGEKIAGPAIMSRRPPSSPPSVLILGGGAAGTSAASTLRREGYEGPVTVIDPDADSAVDRPNLSKDYLAGNAPPEWLPLYPDEWYAERKIERLRGRTARTLDVQRNTVTLDDGSAPRFGSLIIATGAEPVRLSLAVAAGKAVHYLRTLADSRSIIAAAKKGDRAVVLGAGFIGLEVAASLRTRGLDVHVVAPEQRPLERVMGPELGAFIQSLHEAHGVVFHMARTAGGVETGGVRLSDGTLLPAELVVVGAGVRPSVALAQTAGLAVDNGILVDEYLRTSVPNVFAAGDLARWPYPLSGERVRVEHWVVAERHGQAAARNVLGHNEPFLAVPFFWSQHYDVSISYVGHASQWDAIEISGSLADRDAVVTFRRGGREAAIATVFRDQESLRGEMRMELAAAGSAKRR